MKTKITAVHENYGVVFIAIKNVKLVTFDLIKLSTSNMNFK